MHKRDIFHSNRLFLRTPNCVQKLLYTFLQNIFLINSQKAPDPCTGVGYLTVFDGGRLGNKMSQYVTLLAHASRLGVPAFISKHMNDDLAKHFITIR